jgi:hypothetical protein
MLAAKVQPKFIFYPDFTDNPNQNLQGSFSCHFQMLIDLPAGNPRPCKWLPRC